MHAWPAVVVSGPGRAGGGDPEDQSLLERVQAALHDYDIAAVHELAGDLWHVVFHARSERDRAAAELAAAFPALAIGTTDIPDEDWAARSQASLQSIRIGKVIVAPPWDVPRVVTIRPSTGFGTGHHATTRLCLAALQEIELQGKTVIDVGTGSGVLAIAASLLGAGNVIGLDNDPEAIQAARENLALNPGARVTLRVGDVRDAQVAWADVVIANLTGALLVAAAPQLRGLTAEDGRLILSGLMADEEARVRAAYTERTVERRAQEDEWLCLTLR